MNVRSAERDARYSPRAYAQIIQWRAHRAVRKALKAGMLVKPNRCESCPRFHRLEAHHDDYTQPLVVRWLCRRCHAILHLHTELNSIAQR